MEKTWSKIKPRFYFPFLKSKVYKYIQECATCQKIKPAKIFTAPLTPIKRASRPGQTIQMDIAGPLPVTVTNQNRYLLVIVDTFSKFLICYAMQDQVAETVAEKLLDYVCKFGIPDEILTDRGTNFISELLQEVYDLLDILRLRTSPFWPEGNGLSEENVKAMKNMINAFITVTQNTWDQHINELCFAFNTAEHCSTKFTPFEVQFARTPKLPIDLFYNTDDNEDTVTIDLNLRVEEYADRTQNKLKKLFKLVKNNQELKMNKAKLRYDRNVRAAKVKEGDLVLILDQGPKKGLNKKLMPRWKGPYRVLQVISETNYKIQTINTLRKRTFVVHRNKIKRYYGNATVTEIPIETRK